MHKSRLIGDMRFSGQLVMRNMLSPEVVFLCSDELLCVASPEALEMLFALLDTILGAPHRSEGLPRDRWEELLLRVELLSQDSRVECRIRCLFRNILEKWWADTQ